MKTVTFFNNKGGVGKTTTIVNLAAFLAKKRNKKMLVLDLDPQSNSTQAIIPSNQWENLYGDNPTTNTIFDYFEKIVEGDSSFNFQPISITASDNNFGVALIPGHLNMSLVDDALSSSWSSLQKPGGLRVQNWLNQLKNNVSKNYDYLFIDVGPSLGALNRSALLNSDFFFTPMATDIFSLLGVKNISGWINNWSLEYYSVVKETFPKTTFYKETFYQKNLINCDESQLVKFIGYSIQQYTARKFKSGIRATKAYDRVASEFPAAILKYLGPFKASSIADNELMLGNIPYAYSIVPLSQTANMPIFELTYETGLRGGQSASVEDYTKYISKVADNFLKNAGDYFYE